MFRAPLLCLLLLSAATPDAQGSDDPSTTQLPLRATRHGAKSGKVPDGSKRAKARNDVRGKCTVMETPLNPISGPCVSVPLELKDSKGTSLGVARTNAQGEFDFAVEEDGPYTLAPSSSYYVVVSPGATVERGKPVDLKIKGKN